MKTTYQFLTISFLIFALILPNVSASDYTKWHLPEGAKARLGKGTINDITYFPDGSKIAVATNIGIWIYDAKTGKELDLIIGNTGTVNSVSFSPDGNILAGAGSYPEGTVRLWNAATIEHVATLMGHYDSVTSISYSPDGKTIASVHSDGTVRLWNAGTAQYKTSFKLGYHTISSVVYSPDGKTIASAISAIEGNNNICFWDATTGKLKASFTDHTGSVRSVAYSPDGKTIASASDDKTVRLWNANTGELEIYPLLGHTDSVRSVVYSPDGKTIASASDDKTVRLWNANTGELEIYPLLGHTDSVRSVVYSPDGKTIASASDAEVRLWDAATGKHKTTLIGHTPSRVHSVVYSPDGKTIASASDAEVRLWDAAEVRLWDAATGKHKTTLIEHTDTGSVHSVVYSPDGKTIASATDAEVRLWDAATEKHKYSPDGKTIAGKIRSYPKSNEKLLVTLNLSLWDANTGKLKTNFVTPEKVSIFHIESEYAFAYSPDGRTIANGREDGTVQLWDITTRKHKITLKGHASSVCSVAYSPDGRTIASAASASYEKGTPCRGKSIRLWDTVTGKHKTTLTGYIGDIICIAYSPDGKIIAGGNSNGTILLWDVSMFASKIPEKVPTDTQQLPTLQTPSMVSQQKTENTTQQANASLTPQQIAEKALASTVLIVMGDANGKPLSSGSGFFIEKGLIVTNHHVVEKGTRGTYKQVGKDKWYNITDTVKIDKQRDLVILKVSDIDAPALPLGDSNEVQIGQSVYAVGNPIGFLEGTFAPGFISSIRGKEPNKSIQITAPVSPGSSGGPLLNDKGQVIGIVVGGITEGQNLNFAIPSNYLKELLDKVKNRK